MTLRTQFFTLSDRPAVDGLAAGLCYFAGLVVLAKIPLSALVLLKASVTLTTMEVSGLTLAALFLGCVLASYVSRAKRWHTTELAGYAFIGMVRVARAITFPGALLLLAAQGVGPAVAGGVCAVWAVGKGALSRVRGAAQQGLLAWRAARLVANAETKAAADAAALAEAQADAKWRAAEQVRMAPIYAA